MTAQPQPPQQQEAVPPVVANCKITSKLGQGGMGSVFRAVHTTLGRKIALKILPQEFTRSPEYVARFLREARAVANLSHANVVGVHDAGEERGIYYIAMELVDGASMGGLTRHYKPLSERACLDFFGQAAQGLNAAHRRDLVHRDIKPENMLVDRDGVLKIVDFGLVLEQTSDSHLTRTGTFLGTPVYMSPEQCDGEVADARSDIYSLGATFYALLCGKPPFQAPTALGILYKHKFEEPPDPRTLVPGVSEATSQVILKCLKKKREDRFQNCKELADAIKKAQAGLSADADGWDFDEALKACAAKQPKEQPVNFSSAPLPDLGAAATMTPGTVQPAYGRTAPLTPGATPAPSGYEPTMVTPGAPGQMTPRGTPAPFGQTPATPGFEPTLIQPGATPAPQPLGEMPTPSGASGPGGATANRKGMILIGAAVAALVVIGAGGYVVFGTLQRKGELDQVRQDVSKYIEEKNHDKAYNLVASGLEKFQGDEELIKLQQQIKDYYLKSAKDALAESDQSSERLAAAAEAVSAGLTKFEGDAKLAALKTQIVEKYETMGRKRYNDFKLDDALALVNTARRYFRGEGPLDDLRDDIIKRIDLKVSKHEDQYIAEMKKVDTFLSGGKPKEAIDLLTGMLALNFREADIRARLAEIYTEQSKQAEQDNLALALEWAEKARDAGGDAGRVDALKETIKQKAFDEAMTKSKEAEANQNLTDALKHAREAHKHKPADERIGFLETQIEISKYQKLVESYEQAGQFREQANTLEEIAERFYKDSEASKSQYVEQRAKAMQVRKAGFEREIAAAEKVNEWGAAITRIDEALKYLGGDAAMKSELEARRRAADQKVQAVKDYAGQMDLAKGALGRGDWSTALFYLDKALKQKKDDAEASKLQKVASARQQLSEGSGAFGKYEWELARNRYADALASAKDLPDDADATLKDDIAKALKDLDARVKQIASDKSDAKANADKGEYDRAIQIYDRLATDDAPRSGEYKAQAAALKREKEYAANLAKGKELLARNDFFNARKSFERALEQKPEDAAAKAEIALVEASQHYADGETARGNKDWKKAKEAYDAAQAKLPAQGGDDLRKQIGAGLKSVNEKSQEIEKLLKEAEQKAKSKNLSDLQVAHANYTQLGNQLDPTNSTEYTQKADDVSKQIEKLAKDANVQKFTGLMSRARSEYGSNRYDQALSLVVEALTVLPNDQSAKRFKGEIEAAKKAYEERARRFRQHYDQANQLKGQGQFDRALAEIEAALKEFPSDANATNLKHAIEQAKLRPSEEAIRAVAARAHEQLKAGNITQARQLVMPEQQQYPQVAEFRQMSDALIAMDQAVQAAGRAKGAVQQGQRVTGLPKSAESYLKNVEKELDAVTGKAAQEFGQYRYEQAAAEARSAGASVIGRASAAINTAAEVCRKEAEAAKGSGGSGGHRVEVGEMSLEGTGSGKRGDPKKEQECRAAEQQLLRLAAGLR